jgi:hypothetical protein
MGPLDLAMPLMVMLAAAAAQDAKPPEAKPLVPSYEAAMIAPVPAAMGVDPFYKKYTDALGIPVMSSDKVPDAALLMARDIVIYMTSKRQEFREAMIGKHWRVGVMAVTESTTDIPEHRDRKKPAPGDPRLTEGRSAATRRIPALPR